MEPNVVLNLRVRIGGSRSPPFSRITRPTVEVTAAAKWVRRESSQQVMMTTPVESRTRAGARGAKRGSPESPRYAEVRRGRTAVRKEIKMRRGSRSLMNVERAWDSAGRGAPGLWY